MTAIRFEHFVDHLELMNPLQGFAWERQEIEVYRDPLLGHTSVYNPALEAGVKVFLNEADVDLLERMAVETQKTCVFCPERVAGVARFPEALIPGGVVKVGEATAFPNLIGLGGYHSVAIVSQAHFLPLTALTPDLIQNAWLALREVAQAVRQTDNRAHYLTVHGNYLFPAGASLMHPHFQMLMGSEPYTHHARLDQANMAYQQANGQGYGHDLIAAEQDAGLRYIAATGRWHWLAAFAPLGTNEITAVHQESAAWTTLEPQDFNDLAVGLAAALQCYAAMGHWSFNYTLYAWENNTTSGHHCLLRVMTRQNPAPQYRSDDFYLQKGLQTELMLHRPEVLAARARPFFVG